MVEFQKPEELEELLASYVLGDLTPEEVALVNQLLDSRPELKDEVDRLQKTLALLPLSLPKASPPSRLKTRILRNSETVSLVSNSKWVVSGLTARLGAMGSIAVAVIVGLGLYSYYLHQEVAAARETIALLRQPSNRLLSFQGTAPISQASGSLVVVPRSDVAVLTLKNLAPLPEGKVYRLWAVKDAKKIYCGDFTPNSEGNVLLKLPLDKYMSGASAAAITVEPSQKNSHPTGETVMTGSTLL